MCQEFGIETEGTVIPWIASYFGGGMGGTGSVCGAVAGAVMAIGLQLPRAKTVEAGLSNYVVVQEFRRRFEAAMGTINCRELTGVDLTTKEGLEELMRSKTGVCFAAVATAYRVVVEVLKEAA